MMWSLMNLAPRVVEQAAEHGAAAAGGHHVPVLVEWINLLLGPTVYRLQEAILPTIYGWFGAQWHGDPEMPIPPHIVFFFIAVFISVVVLYLVRGRLSVENPSPRQQFFELIFEGLRSLMKENIGPHYIRYFPVIGMFAVLIGVCNLMGLVPFLEAPTANFNVPLSLAVMSFLYYNYIGIKENGPLGHIKHFTGPVAAIAVIFLPVEIVSNFARIVSLSLRLFANIFGDENIAKAFMDVLAWGLPIFLMPIAVIVAILQTFIFVILSIIYISEVTHHEEKHEVSMTREKPSGAGAEA